MHAARSGEEGVQMSYDNNEAEYEPSAPKKADVLIKSTQTIVSKQEELAEQTKIAISRIDEAIELCNKNSQEASYLLEHSTEMFDKLHGENSALKQELLYLAKQSENIYAGLAEKLNELSAQPQPQQGEEQAVGAEYYELADRLNEIYDRLAEMTARIDALSAGKSEDSLNEKFAILYDKIDAVAVDNARPVQSMDGAAIMDKLDRIMENVRRNEGAHSMLADKFEILSMRVEQFGFESAKSQPTYSQPASAYPAPVQTAEIDYDKLASKVAEILSVRETVSPDYIASRVAEQIVMPEQSGVEIDTQKIAEEVAALIDVRPAEPQEPFDGDAMIEKLADRVSEIVAEAKAEPLDEDALAERLAGRINVTAEAAPVEIDEQSLADRIAEKLNVTTEAAPVAEAQSDGVVFDDDALVEKIAARINVMIAEAAPAASEVAIDQEDLADAIALKVGSLKPEDFEILVDDAGCASISKEIAEKLDYNVISSVIADKLRDVLDINAANAPDYEDMAERISEKITVAGINEDAIADKAAAVLSNYLPEFDTEEIADKVTGAVIDVVSAMPQPTLDSEAICNEISERLIEKQEDNNYDIVIDDDGISRITAIVTDEIHKDTEARFDKIEESIAKITELLTPAEEDETEVEAEEYDDEPVVDAEARFDRIDESIAKLTELLTPSEEESEEEYEEESETEETEEVEEEYASDGITEEELASLSEVVASEIEKGTASRFDKVEEDIAKIYELVSNIVVEESEGEYAEAVEYDDADYTQLSEIVASEIEKGVASRLDSVEEKLTSLTEMFENAEEEVVEPEETEEEYAEESEEVDEDAEEDVYAEEDISEEDYARLSELVERMESSISSRFDTVEEKLTSLTELMTVEDAEDVEETEEDYAEEVDDGEYTRLSEIVSARFDSVEDKINSLTELISSGGDDYEEYEDATEEDYEKLSGLVAAEIEKGVSARFDSVEENIRKINAIVGGIAVAGVVTNGGEPRNVETDIRLYEQFDRVAYDIKKISEYVEGDVPVIANERMDKIAGEIAKISRLVEGELSIETNARLDKLQEEVEKLTAMLGGTVDSEDSERLERLEGGVDEIKGMLIGGAVIASADETAAAQTAEVEEEEQELVTVSDLVKPITVLPDEEEDDDDDGDFLLSALDMDKFSEDEHMPGELGDFENGVDFENMMKYNRSFIARIIQSDDDTKQYYGAVKHALLSYKKVNSNVAWGNERFNKGRETIARMKIRGKTLVIYLALDPTEYKTSVYHHADVSDNRSVLGTPMMIKVKSPLGVRKAIRLIDEMLAKRDGEKREIPERDYAAMYPYETIAELIEDGLVKDVRKK